MLPVSIKTHVLEKNTFGTMALASFRAHRQVVAMPILMEMNLQVDRWWNELGLHSYHSRQRCCRAFNPWDFIWNIALDPPILMKMNCIVPPTDPSIDRLMEDKAGVRFWGGNAYYNNVEVQATE